MKFYFRWSRRLFMEDAQPNDYNRLWFTMADEKKKSLAGSLSKTGNCLTNRPLRRSTSPWKGLRNPPPSILLPPSTQRRDVYWRQQEKCARKHITKLWKRTTYLDNARAIYYYQRNYVSLNKYDAYIYVTYVIDWEIMGNSGKSADWKITDKKCTCLPINIQKWWKFRQGFGDWFVAYWISAHFRGQSTIGRHCRALARFPKGNAKWNTRSRAWCAHVYARALVRVGYDITT